MVGIRQPRHHPGRRLRHRRHLALPRRQVPAGESAGCASRVGASAGGRAHAAARWPSVARPADVHAFLFLHQRLVPDFEAHKSLCDAGITLSPNQVKRGTELAAERGLDNVKFQASSAALHDGAAGTRLPRPFAQGWPEWAARWPLVRLTVLAWRPLHAQVMDALKMEFPDNSFDLVWACESGEHMPDKKVRGCAWVGAGGRPCKLALVCTEGACWLQLGCKTQACLLLCKI